MKKKVSHHFLRLFFPFALVFINFETKAIDTLGLENFNPQVFQTNKGNKSIDFDSKSEVDGVYKVVFRISNTGQDSLRLFLYTGSNQIVSVRNNTQILKGGKYTPTSQRADKNHFYFIPLLIKPLSEVQYELEIKNEVGWSGKRSLLARSVVKPDWRSIQIYTEDAYLQKIAQVKEEDRYVMSILFVFLGAMGFTAIFVYLLYFLNRQRVFLLYGCYLISYFLFGIFHTRHYSAIGQWLGEYPVFQQLFPETLIWVGMFFYGYFAIELLQIRKDNYPRIRKYIVLISWFVMLAGILIAVVNLYSNNLSWNIKMVEYIRYIYSPLGAIGIFLFVFKVRSPLTLFLVIGVSIWAIVGNYSSTFALSQPYQLTAVGLGNNDAIFWTCIGLMLESIMFSFALGKRIKLSEDEKLANKEALIENLNALRQFKEEENVRLEEQVSQKTQELLAANSIVEEQKKREIKKDYEKRLAISEMNALRSQMNPHFIFNSLSSIKYLVLSDQKSKSASYLGKFAKLMRQILDFSRKEQVSLMDELSNIQIYLELEAERFGDTFRYEISTLGFSEDELSAIEIPSLLLQPYVENALLHGLQNSTKAEKILQISVNEIGGKVLLKIQDNGIGRSAAANYKKNHLESLGTQITNERIALYNETFGADISVNYLDSNDGTVVEIWLSKATE